MIKQPLNLVCNHPSTQETVMPLTRVSMRRGKPAAYRKAILEGIYQAMRETFDVPEGDRFMTIAEHDEDDFVYDAKYLDIRRSDDLVIIQLTVSNTRPAAQKQKLYRRIVELLTKNPGLRAEDIFINLVEVLPENWSFGRGEAQYVR
jgi:phenylpyruvate tautomerase PptA (4-oxalocrotonate tautomerase family)